MIHVTCPNVVHPPPALFFAKRVQVRLIVIALLLPLLFFNRVPFSKAWIALDHKEDAFGVALRALELNVTISNFESLIDVAICMAVIFEFEYISP